MTSSVTSAPPMVGGDWRSLVVIGAGVAAALHVGKLPPALPALSESLQLSLVQAGFLISLVQLAGMVLGLAVGLAADALGLRRTMISGLCLLTVASAAGAYATRAESLLALRALEGMGFLLASMPAPSLVRRLVAPARLPGRLGLWGAYMPLGTGLALLAGPMFVSAWGWAPWWWAAALCSGIAALGVWWVVPADPPAAASRAPGPGLLREALGVRGPWLLAVAFALYSAQWLAVVGFLPSIYAQAGLAPAIAGPATALAAGSNIVGNVAAGWLLQRGAAPGRLLGTGYAAMALGAMLAFADLWQAPWATAAAYAGVLLFSAVGGLIPATLFVLAVRLSPSQRSVSATVGLMQQWSAFGQVAGPPLVAWVATQSGGWQRSWLVTGACAALGLLLARSIAAVERGEHARP